jgi:hypothetical protein
VESEDANLLAEAVLKMSQMTVQERDKLGLNGKEYVMAKHDYKILAGDFLKGVL